MTMAQKRLIDKKISLSEKVADLELLGQLLYERMIIHADDFGLLQASPRTIKAQVVPMIDTTLDEVARNLTKMIHIGLVAKIKINDGVYLRIVGHEREQKLRRDMQPYTILPVELSGDYKTNWKTIDELVTGSVQVRNELVTGSGTEVKRREENKLAKANWVKDPGVEEKKEFGNENVNHVLANFKKIYGFNPTDKFPRRSAHNLIQQIKKLLKTRGKDPQNGILTTAIDGYFTWVSKQDWAENVQNLDTIRRKITIFEASLPEVANEKS